MQLNTIMLGDCRELAKSIPDNSIDFIFTDPPYDKPSVYLYEWLAQEATRILKPGAFLLCYIGTMWLPEIVGYLEKHLTYHWMFMQVDDGDNVLVHNRRIQCGYKAILSFSKGKSLPDTYVMERVRSPRPDKRFHHWGQSETVARYFIEKFSKPGDTLFEPFVGGGTVPYVCKQLGRHFYACEENEQAYLVATKRLETIQTMWYHS